MLPVTISSFLITIMFLYSHPLFSELMDNKVFYQHPDLMRVLSVHETVMAVMVNTLSKSSVTAGGDSEGETTESNTVNLSMIIE